MGGSTTLRRGNLATNAPIAARSCTQSLIDVRAAIDPPMARMAAENATPGDIQVMEDALTRMEKHIGDYPVLHEANMAFWDALSRSTQRPLFSFLSPALRRITQSVGMIPNETGQAFAVDCSRTILEAVAAGDGDAAFAAMQKLETHYLNLSEFYPLQMAKTISWADVSEAI